LKQLHGVGGSIDELGISLHGDNNVSIFAPYNPVSNLPELELCPLPTNSKVWHHDSVFSDKELMANLSVLDDTNQNLQQSQKELILWHNCLSHINISKVRTLTRPKQWVAVSPALDDSLHVDAILPTKHSSTSKCDYKDLKCASCLMAKARR
jgi:predicted NAD/FAD-binding protein